MARQSSDQHFDALRDTFGRAMRLVLFITLPSMAGLIVLREPIISMLFERDAFGQETVRLTASALLYYGVGLWAFAAVRVVLNVFYALKDTRTPVKMAVVSIAANIIFGVTLMGVMQHNGLALAVTLASIVNIGMLTVALQKKLGALGWRRIAVSAAKSAVCAAVMGFGVWLASFWLIHSETDKGITLLPGVIGCVMVGVFLFAGSAHLIRIPELKHLYGIIANRQRRK